MQRSPRCAPVAVVLPPGAMLVRRVFSGVSGGRFAERWRGRVAGRERTVARARWRCSGGCATGNDLSGLLCRATASRTCCASMPRCLRGKSGSVLRPGCKARVVRAGLSRGGVACVELGHWVRCDGGVRLYSAGACSVHSWCGGRTRWSGVDLPSPQLMNIVLAPCTLAGADGRCVGMVVVLGMTA